MSNWWIILLYVACGAVGAGWALYERYLWRKTARELARINAIYGARMTVCSLDGTHFADMPTCDDLIHKPEFSDCVTEYDFINAIRNEVHHDQRL